MWMLVLAFIFPLPPKYTSLAMVPSAVPPRDLCLDNANASRPLHLC